MSGILDLFKTFTTDGEVDPNNFKVNQSGAVTSETSVDVEKLRQQVEQDKPLPEQLSRPDPKDPKYNFNEPQFLPSFGGTKKVVNTKNSPNDKLLRLYTGRERKVENIPRELGPLYPIEGSTTYVNGAPRSVYEREELYLPKPTNENYSVPKGERVLPEKADNKNYRHGWRRHIPQSMYDESNKFTGIEQRYNHGKLPMNVRGNVGRVRERVTKSDFQYFDHNKNFSNNKRQLNKNESYQPYEHSIRNKQQKPNTKTERFERAPMYHTGNAIRHVEGNDIIDPDVIFKNKSGRAKTNNYIMSGGTKNTQADINSNVGGHGGASLDVNRGYSTIRYEGYSNANYKAYDTEHHKRTDDSRIVGERDMNNQEYFKNEESYLVDTTLRELAQQEEFPKFHQVMERNTFDPNEDSWVFPTTLKQISEAQPRPMYAQQFERIWDDNSGSYVFRPNRKPVGLAEDYVGTFRSERYQEYVGNQHTYREPKVGRDQLPEKRRNPGGWAQNKVPEFAWETSELFQRSHDTQLPGGGIRATRHNPIAYNLQTHQYDDRKIDPQHERWRISSTIDKGSDTRAVQSNNFLREGVYNPN